MKREPRPNLELSPILAKLSPLLTELDRCLVERGMQARLALLALLAGHHVLLIGPPGTAKSLLARALCSCVRQAQYFEYLLSKFTHPDELFGPVSIPGLKEEDYRRITEGYLPRAHVAFLDEIFKANSAILNSLLTLINERVFHHGKHRDRVPLLGLVGASNELPEAAAGLQALYDRFLVRLAVPPIASEEHFLRVSLGELPSFRPAEELRLTVPELRRLRELAAALPADPSVRAALPRIRAKLHEAGIEVSDRRWRWALDLLRMSALTSNRRSISPLDLLLLEHCLGDPNDVEGSVRRCIREGLAGVARGEEQIAALKQAWTERQKKPVPVAFPQWRAEALARVDGFSAECDRSCSALDSQLERLQAEQKQTPWLLDPPSELAAGLLAARMQIGQFKSFVGPVRAKIVDYRPAQAAAEGLSLRSSGWNHHSGAALYLRSQGAAENQWIGLHSDGSGTTGPARADAPRLELDDATAHRLLFENEPTKLAKELAATAVKPLAAQTGSLSHQARYAQDALAACTQALTAAIQSLCSRVRPPWLPSLPEPAKEAQGAKPRA